VNKSIAVLRGFAARAYTIGAAGKGRACTCVFIGLKRKRDKTG